MRIVLIGSVSSSERTLRKLIEHGLDVVAVFGYRAPNMGHVSDLADLEPTATRHGIDFVPFERINDQVERVRSYRPGMLFVVGLSQLVRAPLLNVPEHGCVGFHPTALPLGRGRAPLAWIILDECPAAATFFRLGEGVDDGPIYVQETVETFPEDDVTSLGPRLGDAIDSALDRWLPRIARGEFDATEQDHDRATWYTGRVEADGRLAWSERAVDLARLVRATTRPYPGAFAVCAGVRVRVWRAVPTESRVTGVPGAIVEVHGDGSFVAQTGEGHLHVLDHEPDEPGWKPSIHKRFELGGGLSWPSRSGNA